MFVLTYFLYKWWRVLREQHTWLAVVAAPMDHRLLLSRPQRVVALCISILANLALSAALFFATPTEYMESIVISVLSVAVMLPFEVLVPRLFIVANTFKSAHWHGLDEDHVDGDEHDKRSKHGKHAVGSGRLTRHWTATVKPALLPSTSTHVTPISGLKHSKHSASYVGDDLEHQSHPGVAPGDVSVVEVKPTAHVANDLRVVDLDGRTSSIRGSSSKQWSSSRAKVAAAIASSHSHLNSPSSVGEMRPNPIASVPVPIHTGQDDAECRSVDESIPGDDDALGMEPCKCQIDPWQDAAFREGRRYLAPVVRPQAEVRHSRQQHRKHHELHDDEHHDEEHHEQPQCEQQLRVAHGDEDTEVISVDNQDHPYIHQLCPSCSERYIAHARSNQNSATPPHHEILASPPEFQPAVAPSLVANPRQPPEVYVSHMSGVQWAALSLLMLLQTLIGLVISLVGIYLIGLTTASVAANWVVIGLGAVEFAVGMLGMYFIRHRNVALGLLCLAVALVVEVAALLAAAYVGRGVDVTLPIALIAGAHAVGVLVLILGTLWVLIAKRIAVKKSLKSLLSPHPRRQHRPIKAGVRIQAAIA